MKKIFLSFIGFSLICRQQVFSQTKPDSSRNKPAISLSAPVIEDSSNGYKSRALRLDEVNLVSSYYNQTSNHSSVTGDNPNFLNNGVNTNNANVMDLSNGIDLKFVWLNEALNKNTLSTGLGVDYHTAASAAYVSKTGASKTGGSRIYPSIDWTVENAKKGSGFGIGSYYSGEYNYNSFGADLHFSQKTGDKMGEFSAKLQAYLDQVSLIYPAELIPKSSVTSGIIITTASGRRSGEKPQIPSSPRNTYSGSLSYSQIISKRFQVVFMGDVVAQSGYLSLPFHRVWFTPSSDPTVATHAVEKLPSSRFKLPLGLRANYFLGDNIILRSYYRYYMDNWGTNANTASLEVAYKVTPFFSISPFYRYYSQSAAKYFAPFEAHSPTDQYYTSNYEYAKFRAGFYGVGFRIAPPNGVFGSQHFHELEIRYGHYTQTTDLVSDVLSVSLGFK
ncbi:MAG: DUF3570 domain-containing protein [Sphingobacteriales bacterium]